MNTKPVCPPLGCLLRSPQLAKQRSRPARELRQEIIFALLAACEQPHGRLWKALMRAHLGDWEASAERLQQAASRCPAQAGGVEQLSDGKRKAAGIALRAD